MSVCRSGIAAAAAASGSIALNCRVPYCMQPVAASCRVRARVCYVRRRGGVGAIRGCACCAYACRRVPWFTAVLHGCTHACIHARSGGGGSVKRGCWCRQGHDVAGRRLTTCASAGCMGRASASVHNVVTLSAAAFRLVVVMGWAGACQHLPPLPLLPLHCHHPQGPANTRLMMIDKDVACGTSTAPPP